MVPIRSAPVSSLIRSQRTGPIIPRAGGRIGELHIAVFLMSVLCMSLLASGGASCHLRILLEENADERAATPSLVYIIFEIEASRMRSIFLAYGALQSVRGDVPVLFGEHLGNVGFAFTLDSQNFG